MTGMGTDSDTLKQLQKWQKSKKKNDRFALKAT